MTSVGDWWLKSFDAAVADSSEVLAAGTFAQLPSPATAPIGTRGFITDSTVATFAATAAGGGANKVPVFNNGTNWLVG